MAPEWRLRVLAYRDSARQRHREDPEALAAYDIVLCSYGVVVNDSPLKGAPRGPFRRAALLQQSAPQALRMQSPRSRRGAAAQRLCSPRYTLTVVVILLGCYARWAGLSSELSGACGVAHARTRQFLQHELQLKKQKRHKSALPRAG